jgi:aerobic-type carbon monoxide dehydrogenase small subunit (CoxS/CutS family)
VTGQVALTVNGRKEEIQVDPLETLAGALRRELRLFGVREVCGIGVCGSCTLLIDGAAHSGCLILAGLADGLDVTTIEGLAPNGELDPIQQAFIDNAAFQCSFCTPGFILATRALLAEEPDPTADQVRASLAGNLCRCGSYTRIERAVLDAAQRLSGRSAESTEP